MLCTHPAGAITDHTVRGYDREAVRYAWRGACLECQRGVVGVTSVSSALPPDRLHATLTGELMAYLGVSRLGA